MKKVYVLDVMRTPIVVANGKFKNIRPEIWGAEILKTFNAKYNLNGVDEIIAGNAVGTGGNIARLMALLAGFDEIIPAYTVDMQCASSATAISIGFAKIASGICECCVVGGMESASLQPLKIYDKNDDRFDKVAANDIKGGYYTAQFSPDTLSPTAMLEGAERVARAEKVSKAELDAWAMESHKRAAKAVNILADSMVEINGVKADNGIKANISQRLLDRAPLPLGSGTITSAGNACRINDGAAFAILVSENFLNRNNLKAMAVMKATASIGGNPEESPRGAMLTADFLLDKNNLSYDDLNAIEFNEAFAVIDVLFERAHPNLVDRYNRLGGAIAYGHPYGASGAILLLHLIKSLQTAGGGLGILSIAGAGGVGEAILIEVN